MTAMSLKKFHYFYLTMYNIVSLTQFQLDTNEYNFESFILRF